VRDIIERINLDGAGNVIYNQKFDENDKKSRNFLLIGLGVQL
jgi:hypothetical protein